MLLALGFVTVGVAAPASARSNAIVAAPASAHSNAISAAVTCTSDYKWLVTWSVTNSMKTVDEQITHSSDLSLVREGTNIPGGQTVTFTEVMAAPAKKVLTLEATWPKEPKETKEEKESKEVTNRNSATLTTDQFTPGCSSPVVTSTGLYLYQKVDPNTNASWSNSGKQTKIATWAGWSYYNSTYPGTLPSYVCGPGWGVQQDQITGPQSLFPANILYPDGGFLPGVLHGSLHLNLSSLVKVPDCAPIPHVTVTTGVCLPGDGGSSKTVSVELSNTGNVPVTFTSTNGINATLQAGETKTVTANSIAHTGGSFDVVATGTGFTKTFPITIAAFPDCTVGGGLPTHPLVTPTVTSSNITCDAPGSYTLSATEGVVWTVDGTVKPAGTYGVAAASTVHAVASTTSSDFGFDANQQTVWDLVFTTPTDCGQLVTHPLVVPQVDSVDRTCSVNGSYTLASVEGVLYTVDGVVQPAGTYQVSSAKTVHVVASTTSSDFGFDANQQTVWDLVFTTPTDCGKLTTLAFTGVNGGIAGGLLVGMILLMMGAGAITVNRVKARTR